MKFDTRVAVVLRDDLPTWQKLNVTAFTMTGIASIPDTVGEAYVDGSGMEQYTIGLLNGIKKWKSLKITIDSLRVSGDTAFVTASQHMDRMALRPDNQVHHVETWATQREIWIRVRGTWLLWRVDSVRNQRRLIDGVPG